MVGTLRSLVPPLRGLATDIFYVDGGRFRISVSTNQEGHRRRFLALIMGAPGSPALAPPKWPAVDVS
jgi:hypothetical protein